MWYHWVCSSAVMKQHTAFVVWNVVTCGTTGFVVLLLQSNTLPSPSGMWYDWVCSSAVMKQHTAFVVWNVVTCGTVGFVVLPL